MLTNSISTARLLLRPPVAKGLGRFYRQPARYFGHGYATEPAAARDTGFTQLGVTEIFGLVRPDHAVSIRGLEKTGMRRKGVLDDVPGHAPSLVYSVTIHPHADTGS